MSYNVYDITRVVHIYNLQINIHTLGLHAQIYLFLNDRGTRSKKFGDHCSKQPDLQEIMSTSYLC